MIGLKKQKGCIIVLSDQKMKEHYSERKNDDQTMTIWIESTGSIEKKQTVPGEKRVKNIRDLQPKLIRNFYEEYMTMRVLNYVG